MVRRTTHWQWRYTERPGHKAPRPGREPFPIRSWFLYDGRGRVRGEARCDSWDTDAGWVAYAADGVTKLNWGIGTPAPAARAAVERELSIVEGTVSIENKGNPKGGGSPP